MNDEGNSAESQEGRVRFAESDYHETKMDYDDGQVPLYVVVAWVALLLGFVGYMVVFALPDLSAWGAP